MNKISYFLISVILLTISALDLQAQPLNDDLCDATLIQLGVICDLNSNGDNTGATNQIGEVIGTCMQGTPNSVWYKFVAPASGLVSIRTQNAFTGTLNDTQIALYELTGNDCNRPADLRELECSDDVSPPVQLNAAINSARVTPGVTYYVSVSGFNDGEGTFCLEIEEEFSPANDQLCGALPLTVGASCNGLPNGDNSGATSQTGEPLPSCFVDGPNSVWFSFVGPASGWSSITTDIKVGGTHPDTEIALYALPGGDCAQLGDLILISCDQDGGDSLSFASTINLAPTPTGQTFYVQVSGWQNTEGSFCIEVNEQPEPLAGPINDDFCDAKLLQVNDPCDGPVENLTHAVFEIGEPYPDCFGGDLNSIWYKFVVPPSGLFEVRTDKPVGGSAFDTQMAIYRLPGNNCNDITQLELILCDQDGGKFITNNAAIFSDELTPGEMIYVQVASQDPGTTFCMEVNEITRPVNDDACNAISVAVDGQVRDFDNLLASIQTGEENISPPQIADCNAFDGWCFNNTLERTVWFSFVAPTTGAVNIDLCNNRAGTDFDTRIAVYQTNNCADFGSYSLVGANDDILDCGFASFVELVCLTPGETYMLMVSAFPNTQGTFSLSMEAVNPDPIQLSATTVTPYCPGGESGAIELNALGGTPPYSYLWSNNATTPVIGELTPGNYTVTTTDACGVQATLTVNVADTTSGLDVGLVQDEVICIGDSVQLNGNPSGGLSFVPENAFGQLIGDSALVRLDTDDPINTVNISTMPGRYFASDFGPGGMYVMEVDGNYLQRMDTVTGRLTTVGRSVPAFNHRWTSLAWDQTRSQMYGISVNLGGAGAKMYKIDFNTGALSDTMDMRIPFPIWLAINANGEFYTMDIDTDTLYSVSPTTAEVTAIGYIGFDSNFAQDADFDPVTGQLIMATMNNDDQFQAINELRVANLSDGSTQLVDRISSGLGQMTTFAISGRPFTGNYQYSWTPTAGLDDPNLANPMASPAQTTTYQLNINDACGTQVQQQVTVVVSDMQLDLGTTPDDGSGTGTATANVSGGIPPFTYDWSTGATTAMIDGLMPGVYSVTVSDSLGCVRTDSVNLIISSLEAQLGISSLQLFPNPTKDLVNVAISLEQLGEIEMDLIDLNGKVLWRSDKKRGLQSSEQIHLQAMAKGMYILQIRTGRGQISKRLFLH